ncbi:hypothetical protein VTN02DRAFT_1395 [Thermoascus thermophilus]
MEYVRGYRAEYPALRPLYVATRMILETRGAFGPRRASVSAYGLLLLVVAALKMHHGRFRRPDSLGEQLLAVLHTYAAVDWRRTGVSVDPPGFFDAASVRAVSPDDDDPAYLRGQRALLQAKRTAAVQRNFPAAGAVCVQDPTNYLNDVGRSCVRSARLQDVLARAHAQLRSAVAEWDEDEDAAEPGGSILAHALQANFEDFERVRSRIVHPWTDEGEE